MLTIARKQLLKHIKSWIGFIVLIAAVAFFLGTCINPIVITKMNYPELAAGAGAEGNPTFAYKQPLEYGALVFLFVIGNVIRMNIESQEEDFRLFALLGAKPSQLSLLLTLQSLFISIFSGLIGYFLSISPMNKIYDKVTELHKTYPVKIEFNVVAMLVTVLSITAISCLATYIHSYRDFNKKYQLTSVEDKTKIDTKLAWYEIAGLILLLGVLLFAIYDLMIKPINYSTESVRSYVEPIVTRIHWIIYITPILSIIFLLLRKKLYNSWLNIFERFFTKRQNYKGIAAVSSLKYHQGDQMGVIIPLVFIVILISGVLISTDPFIQISTNIMNRSDDFNNDMILTLFDKFVAGPLIIIVLNLIILNFFGVRKTKSHDSYYLRLGSKPSELIQVRFIELFINMTFVLVVGLLTTYFSYILTSGFNMRVQMQASDPKFMAVPIISTVVASLIMALEIIVVYLVYPTNLRAVRV